MAALEIQEPALLIRIARLYDPMMTDLQLWEATRGVWRIGMDRDRVKYALAVARGVVREVYEVGAWQPAGTTTYATRLAGTVNIPDRWEFTGWLAPEHIRRKYIDQPVADYFKQGNANPIMYVNIKRQRPTARRSL